MTHNVIPLYPASPHRGERVRPGPRLHSGRRYPFRFQGGNAAYPPAGMVGNYTLNEQQAHLVPFAHEQGEAQAYVYDVDAAQASRDWRYLDQGEGQPYQLVDNHLILKFTETKGPELVSEGPLTHLDMRPSFHLIFSTEAHAAQLGVIHLVQSQRFVTLGNGERFSLLDAETPVLYLSPMGAIDMVARQQPARQHREYCYTLGVRQAIPEQLGGVEVESVTVLEQYQSYFMQRECSEPDDEVIWIPALAPITWGWSIRVGRRADQAWGILRRKQMLPTVGHDGLEFPLWESNHLALSRPLPDGP